MINGDASDSSEKAALYSTYFLSHIPIAAVRHQSAGQVDNLILLDYYLAELLCVYHVSLAHQFGVKCFIKRAFTFYIAIFQPPLFEVHTFSATAYTIFGDVEINRQRGHDWKDVENVVLISVAWLLRSFMSFGQRHRRSRCRTF
jgi:hypothetical protein